MRLIKVHSFSIDVHQKTFGGRRSPPGPTRRAYSAPPGPDLLVGFRFEKKKGRRREGRGRKVRGKRRGLEKKRLHNQTRSQTSHAAYKFIKPRSRLGVGVVGSISASKCLSGTKSRAILHKQVRKVLWTRKGVRATVVTAGHCTHAELTSGHALASCYSCCCMRALPPSMLIH